MKINCSVEINNRVCSVNVVKRRSQRSILAIGRQTVKDMSMYLFWQTLQNKQGFKYKMDNNIQSVFTKFVNDGKATIRLIEPPIDLIIQTDAMQLKKFLNTLKLSLSKSMDPAILGLSNLNPKNMNLAHKRKVKILKSSDYPTLEGFPITTEELHLSGLNRKSFDRHILRLQHLRVLNLSNNEISSLPKELGNLRNLQELILKENKLDKGTKWAWMNQPAIRLSLKLLDISYNMLTKLPDQLRKLDGLVNLKVAGNQLIRLPDNLGALPRLRYLDVSRNKLQCLPGSMRIIKFIELDLSENDFENMIPYHVNKIDVPSLIEYAARVFLKTRNCYDASLIPFTLVKCLDEAKYCPCGNPCLRYYLRKTIEYHIQLLAKSIKSSGNPVIPFDYYFCSAKCVHNYAKLW